MSNNTQWGNQQNDEVKLLDQILTWLKKLQDSLSSGVGISIGSTVTGGTNDQVLYVSNSGTLTGDSAFIRDSTTKYTTISAPVDTGVSAGFLINNDLDGAGAKGIAIFSGDYNLAVTSTGIRVTGSDAASGKITFYEDEDNGTNNVTLTVPSSIATSRTIALPTDAPVSGKIVQTDGSGNWSYASHPEAIAISCSDLTSALSVGTSKGYIRVPFAMTLTSIRGSLLTAATGATLLTIDVNKNGSTILSTKLTFDASEKTTTTAATPAVISDTSISDDDEITVDIDAVGSTTTGVGLIVTLIGTRA